MSGDFESESAIVILIGGALVGASLTVHAFVSRRSG
jgi:hypothetical protein